MRAEEWEECSTFYSYSNNNIESDTQQLKCQINLALDPGGYSYQGATIIC